MDARESLNCLPWLREYEGESRRFGFVASWTLAGKRNWTMVTGCLRNLAGVNLPRQPSVPSGGQVERQRVHRGESPCGFRISPHTGGLVSL